MNGKNRLHYSKKASKVVYLSAGRDRSCRVPEVVPRVLSDC